MTKHERLAIELLKNGKTKSWKEYADRYEISAESARSVWKRIRFDKGYKEKITILAIKNPFGIIPVSKEEIERIRKANDMFIETGKKIHAKKADEEVIKQNYIADLESQLISMSAEKNKAEVTYKVKDEIKTLEELIVKCKIDTNIWNIDKYVQNFWAGNYQVKAFLSKKQIDTDLVAQKELLLEELRKASPTNINETIDIRQYKVSGPTGIKIVDKKELDRIIDEASQMGIILEKNQLLELAVFDLHLGKLSWKGETGEDYDLDIAVKRYKDCIWELIHRVQWSKIDRILLPLGNDMIHIDNKFKTTTNGTPQDTDSRFSKIITIARKLVVDVINDLSLIAPVDVVIVPGNHDQTVMFTLGEILDAFYHNNDRVSIQNDAKLRKYYQYGKNMIMFTHGSEEKHAELGLIAATEEPKMWAETKFREVHLGHLHKSKSIKYTNVDEYQGFKIRIINSLSGTDAWHYSKGYMSLKGAEAFVWDREKGLITNHFYNL